MQPLNFASNIESPLPVAEREQSYVATIEASNGSTHLPAIPSSLTFFYSAVRRPQRLHRRHN